MSTDTISDMLTRIRNGYFARLREVEIFHSKINEALGTILAREGYLHGVRTEEKDGNKFLILLLKYSGGKIPALTNVKRISKPGIRTYTNKHNLPRVRGGMGVAIISTPKGLMTDKQARKEGVGGEIICTVW